MPMQLPAELWLTLVDHIAIAANNHHDGRWRDLAHLAWTCRGAYVAARGPLWQHLRLVFRIGAERNLESKPSNVSGIVRPHRKNTQQLAILHHKQVFESSVFPRYQVGQLSLESERLARIRQVSHEYPHLQPFVVLDGLLYLASLVEHERNPSKPNFSGIRSLWGDDDDGSSVSAGARVVGGLVLVPYPLQVVNELTTDAIASTHQLCSSDFDSKQRCRDNLAFLLDLPPDQIHSWHCNAGYYDDGQPAFHQIISQHFSGIVHHEYLFDSSSDSHSRPDHRQESFRLGPSTAARTIKLFRGPGYGSDRHILEGLAATPIQSYEQYGWGTWHLRADASKFFSSSTLTRLVLDFQLEAFFSYDPFPVHLPVLKHLTLTFDIAARLFQSGNDQHASHSTPAIFPVLTHLTLLKFERDGLTGPTSLPWTQFHHHRPTPLPRIRYRHMPHLTHFLVPLNHRGTQMSYIMDPASLQSLCSDTRLESLQVPGLTSILESSSKPPPTAIYLTHLETTLAAANCLSSFMTVPNLVSLKLNTQNQFAELPLFNDAANLTHLTLVGQTIHSVWLPMLARKLPQLMRLAISISNSTAAQDTLSVHVDRRTGKYPVFPNLEDLSCTLARGTFDCAGLGLPRLKHLAVNTQHPHTFPSMYPHLESLHLTGALCPVQVMRVLNDLPAHCRVKFVSASSRVGVDVCGVSQLRMRFGGSANRHVWRALLGGAPFAKQDGLVKESVAVVLDRPSAQVIEEGDAKLIAQVLAHLLGEQEAASMDCFVTYDSSQGGEPVTAEDVEVGNEIARAIVFEEIGAFSVVGFR